MIDTVRRLVEMAYLYAWGSDGSADKRDEFRNLYSRMCEKYPIGNFVWDGRLFTWSLDTDSDDFMAAAKIYNDVVDGTHYQKQVDALRDMGWSSSAADLVRHLASQGVVVH